MALRTVYDDREVDPHLVAVCGVYCGACPVYRAWVEQDLGRLESLARSMGVDVVRLMCTGCRAPGPLCFGGDCAIKACAEAREVLTCADCTEYPCEKIQKVSSGPGVRSMALENLDRIAEIGWYKWLQEQDAHWRCPSCRGKVSFGDVTCRGCGTSITPKPRTSPHPRKRPRPTR